jgi:hypothetical protein
MSYSESLPVGVVVAREEIDNPWQDHVWRPVAVLPGAPAVDGWKEMVRAGGVTQYHAATLPLELFRKEAEAYQYNLDGEEPVVYVVLSEADEEDEDGFPYRVHLVTASPFEAQDYLDAGECIVEPVRMPPELVAWVDQFVQKYRTEQTFKKRKRDEVSLEDHTFGQEPIVVVRERMAREAALVKAKNGKS